MSSNSRPGPSASPDSVVEDAATRAERLGRERSFLQRFLTSRVVWQFRQSQSGLIGLSLTIAVLLMGVFGPTIAPHDPLFFELGNQLARPSLKHPLGTDQLGRDVLSRLLYGARITLLITSGAVALAVVGGTAFGLTAGFRGGLTDHIIMRGVDIVLAMPTFLLAIAIVAALGPSTRNVIIAVGIGALPDFARISRGSTMAVKQEDYILAAQSLGARNVRIIGRHILPNVTAPLLVQLTLRLAMAVLTASGLSFLGLGPQPPTPEWGAMLSAGRNFIHNSPQLIIVPGLAILLATIGFNLLGDGLRDSLDPRLKQ
jgi:peptide/nickel transport system permease protein